MPIFRPNGRFGAADWPATIRVEAGWFCGVLSGGVVTGFPLLAEMLKMRLRTAPTPHNGARRGRSRKDAQAQQNVARRQKKSPGDSNGLAARGKGGGPGSPFRT